jgi:hypothetical protein
MLAARCRSLQIGDTSLRPGYIVSGVRHLHSRLKDVVLSPPWVPLPTESAPKL